MGVQNCPECGRFMRQRSERMPGSDVSMGATCVCGFSLERETHMVAFSTDHTAAYLLGVWRDKLTVIHRWFKDRPELTTFNPAHWRLFQAHAGKGGTFYDAEPVKGYW